MKRSLLSLIAAVTVLFTVTACGNQDKEVDVQINFIKEAIETVKSADSIEALEVLVQDFNTQLQEFNQKFAEWKVSEEKKAELQAVSAEYSEAAQNALIQLQEKAAAEAAAAAEEAGEEKTSIPFPTPTK